MYFYWWLRHLLSNCPDINVTGIQLWSVTMVLVLAWCRQPPCQDLSQSWPICLLPYLSNRPEWVKSDRWRLIGSTYQRVWNLFPHVVSPLQWRHNEPDFLSNHQPHDCLRNRLFRRRSKKTSKLLVTGLCAGNSPGTGEFPAQRASNAENASIWWRHHAMYCNQRGLTGPHGTPTCTVDFYTGIGFVPHGNKQ